METVLVGIGDQWMKSTIPPVSVCHAEVSLACSVQRRKVTNAINQVGQQADLIAALGQARDHHGPIAPQPHPHRRVNQQSQRLNDGACQEQ